MFDFCGGGLVRVCHHFRTKRADKLIGLPAFLFAI